MSTAAAALRGLFTVSCLLAVFAATAQSGASAELVEVARIGGTDTDPGYLFGRITFVAVANDSSVFVADGQLQLIRYYDSRGEYLADVGRTGEGPGEYREIKGMQILPTGDLVVLSNPNRLTFFDGESGEYVRDFTVQSTLSDTDWPYHAPRHRSVAPSVVPSPVQPQPRGSPLLPRRFTRKSDGPGRWGMALQIRK